MSEEVDRLEERIGWDIADLRKQLEKLRDDYEWKVSQLDREIESVKSDVWNLEQQ